MSCPGAIRSGLRMSPPPARSGPRDENDAVNGAGSLYVMVAGLIVAVAPAVAAYVFTAARSVSARCTVGTKWKSALIEFGEVFTMIIPTPPASCTARLLFTRALVPRSQTTILPATLAGSRTAVPALSTAAKQRRTAVASAPESPAAVASISGAVTAAAATDAPLYVTLLPSFTEPIPFRLCVPAATVVVHGPGCATVEVAGPLLPADSATKIPASAAKRNETSTGSRKFVK